MIICAHRQEPNWPEDRPRFLREHNGVQYWVETEGSPPTPEEMDAFLNPPEPPRTVPKSLVVARLIAAGKIAAANTALEADPAAKGRWYAADHPTVRADDPDAIALLQAIGAVPEVSSRRRERADQAGMPHPLRPLAQAARPSGERSGKQLRQGRRS